MQSAEITSIPFDGQLTGSIAGREKLQNYSYCEGAYTQAIVRIERIEGNDQEVEEKLNNLEAYCCTLESNGIDRVRFLPFLGPRDGAFRKVFMVTERVEGHEVVPHITTFGDLSVIQEQISRLDNFYTLLINHFADQLYGRENLLYEDFTVYQFMYGHKGAEDPNNFIFVDIEPRVVNLDKVDTPEIYIQKVANRLSFNILQTLRSYNIFKLVNNSNGNHFDDNVTHLFELNKFMQNQGIDSDYLSQLAEASNGNSHRHTS